MGHGLLNVVESARDIELQEGSHNRASLYPFVMVLRAFIAGGLVPTIVRTVHVDLYRIATDSLVLAGSRRSIPRS